MKAAFTELIADDTRGDEAEAMRATIAPLAAADIFLHAKHFHRCFRSSGVIHGHYLCSTLTYNAAHTNKEGRRLFRVLSRS